MIHTIPAETCTEAWLKTVTMLLPLVGKSAYNVILDISDPLKVTSTDKAIIHAVDTFLLGHGADPVSTVAGTIFPAAHYRSKQAEGVYETFPSLVYPKVRSGWGDTYAGRMLRRTGKNGAEINPLELMVEKLKRHDVLLDLGRYTFQLRFGCLLVRRHPEFEYELQCWHLRPGSDRNEHPIQNPGLFLTC